jgi:hypothetical protein
MCEVEVAAPVPVEYEGRKLPKTGYYNNTPFCGTQCQRSGWTNHFMDEIGKHGIDLVQPPFSWYDMDPELYAERFMEMGGSVHIAPKYYRRYFDWS